LSSAKKKIVREETPPKKVRKLIKIVSLVNIESTLKDTKVLRISRRNSTVLKEAKGLWTQTTEWELRAFSKPP